MNLIRAAARPMLASMFVIGGVDALRHPDQKAPAAEDVAAIATKIPALESFETADLVRINGAAQLAGGALLAVGKLPRLASAVLAGSLVPTTWAAHRFWEVEDEAARSSQQIQFFKNVSMLGGLLIAAMDTAGKPGLAWRAGHAIEHAGQAAQRTRREAKLATKLAKARARHKGEQVTGHTRREAKLAAKLAKVEAKRALTPDLGDAARGIRSLARRDAA